MVGISHFILKRHLDNGYFPNAANSVIYNGYDAPPAAFKPLGDVITLGFIGRLAPAKGVGMLLEALALLVADNTPVELLIAGDGDAEYVSQLKTQAKNLPVKFVGHQQPADFFRQVDIAVVPSIWNEPLGRVVIEAMANGKPVVATPVGGIPELIKDDCGILSSSIASSDFSTAISKVMRLVLTDAKRIFVCAIEHSGLFSSEKISEKYVGIYRLCLSCDNKKGAL